MYIRQWRGIDLTALPAARECLHRPAGPELYKQFYEAAEARGEPPDPEWVQEKIRMGRLISASVLDRWRQEQGRSPRVLALAAGLALTEGVWLEQGWDVTLQEAQEVSLAGVRARFPNARTVIGDIRQLSNLGKYDVVAMLALDYVLSREELRAVFEKARTWLSEDGWLLVKSVSVLSIRQWAAENVKVLAGIYHRQPHIVWGWWRTPAEFRQIASAAGLKLISAYHAPPDGSSSPHLMKRSSILQSSPSLRQNTLLMLFAMDRAH